jgi:hypothetical protein
MRMQQQLIYAGTTTCAGNPVSTSNQPTTCTGSGSSYSKSSCAAAPSAYAGLMKSYSDSACTSLMMTSYFGVGAKANSCIAQGSGSTQISCSATAITSSSYAAAGCSGATSATTSVNTACVRWRYRVCIRESMRCAQVWVSY